ncbi:ABC transporter permease [Pseudooceanicola sp. CBS1P-1]|uniref:Transport permease protein n=1 Tax=Pseudooceanicola albus TaxID=2692189 RepID=A0A6L7G999_9RHOB|nr:MULTISPECIES: ABC transporter permease [Pseudooceanicola]MBT9386516.1 ABC transporter permease [Pseudooceanicola endophyticus]MXN20549.1 ABC transporter permease [Pseudooceanicola albus]
MLAAMDSQGRVIFAILLREARVRHGRSHLGYGWAVIEPVALILFLTLVFSQLRSSGISGYDFALFFATGVLPFNLFRTSSQYASGALEANRPLFHYPPVQPVDAVLARVLLESATALLVMGLVFGAQIAWLRAPPPAHPLQLLAVLGLAATLAFGVAMCLATAREWLPSLGHLYGVLMGPAFLLSGIFFSLHAMPEGARDMLVWNPLIHIVEGFRSGYLAGYRAPELDLAYLAWFAGGSVVLGLALTLTFGRKAS